MKHEVAAAFIPSWLMRAILSTGATLFLTGAGALAVKGVKVAMDHETRITVVEKHEQTIDETLGEIKDLQREQARDTKEILKRLPPEGTWRRSGRIP